MTSNGKTYTNVLTFNGLQRQLAVSYSQSAVRQFHQTVRRFHQTVSSMEKALVVTLKLSEKFILAFVGSVSLALEEPHLLECFWIGALKHYL